MLFIPNITVKLTQIPQNYLALSLLMEEQTLPPVSLN